MVDLAPGYGPLMGLYTGLKAANGSVFAVGSDMPFLNDALIRHMIEMAPGWDAVVPRPGGLYEPLHAIYSPACLPVMEKMIKENKRKINGCYCAFKSSGYQRQGDREI